jgi:hypothetical protein
MAAKVFIIVTLLLILISLGSGLFYLVRDKGGTDRTVKALTWRTALSLALFALLILAFAAGLIAPHYVAR